MSRKGKKDLHPRARTRQDFVSRLMRLMTSETEGNIEELLEGQDLRRWQRVRIIHSLNMQHGVELSHVEKMRIYRKQVAELHGTPPTERTYYSDQGDCKSIFGPMLNPDLLYLRGVELQIAIRDRSLCRAAGDYKSVVALSKHIMELMRLNQIESKEQEEEKNKPVTVLMQINMGNGETKSLPIDLDRLDKLRPAEIEGILSAMDSPAVDIDQMAKLLNADGTDTDQVQ